MQPLSLARQSENRTGASLGFQTGMCRTATRLDRKDPGSLTTSLCATANSGRFEHQYGMRAARCGFNELFSSAASSFFITSQQQHNRTFGSETSSHAGLQQFNREGAVGLHIKYTWSIGAIPFQPPGALPQRVTWMNGICMAQNDNWLFARFTKSSYP